MRGDAVCGQHLFIIDWCVELRGRDVHMTAWGSVLDAQSCVRADKHTFCHLAFCVAGSRVNAASIDWNLIGKFGPCLIILSIFFVASFGKRIQIHLLASAWLHPLPRRKQGRLLFCFLLQQILITACKCSWKYKDLLSGLCYLELFVSVYSSYLKNNVLSLIIPTGLCYCSRM